MPDKYTYLIIENAIDVCDGIERRMEPYMNWQSGGSCGGVKEAIQLISKIQPQLIFLDWGLNGGSAFEVLQHVQNMNAYNPYILFNTGFQKDNPEIPQEIINNYKVDKYIVKPFWENLRNNLSVYLKEAEDKVTNNQEKEKAIWLEDDNGIKVSIYLDKLICICQHPLHARSRIFYLANHINEINIPNLTKIFNGLLEYDIIALRANDTDLAKV